MDNLIEQIDEYLDELKSFGDMPAVELLQNNEFKELTIHAIPSFIKQLKNKNPELFRIYNYRVNYFTNLSLHSDFISIIEALENLMHKMQSLVNYDDIKIENCNLKFKKKLLNTPFENINSYINKKTLFVSTTRERDNFFKILKDNKTIIFEFILKNEFKYKSEFIKLTEELEQKLEIIPSILKITSFQKFDFLSNNKYRINPNVLGHHLNHCEEIKSLQINAKIVLTELKKELSVQPHYEEISLISKLDSLTDTEKTHAINILKQYKAGVKSREKMSKKINISPPRITDIEDKIKSIYNVTTTAQMLINATKEGLI